MTTTSLFENCARQTGSCARRLRIARSAAAAAAPMARAVGGWSDAAAAATAAVPTSERSSLPMARSKRSARDCERDCACSRRRRSAAYASS
eukprot:4781664-Pleurochrysis_carterae.AAC.1